ncbi:MAG: hypothetical protein Q8N83_14950 [Ignavibacteria bacterium]|nr:hypothetical protein [Ignavibacteria bacterium]
MKKTLTSFLLSLVLFSQIFSQTLSCKYQTKFENKLIDGVSIYNLFYSQTLLPLPSKQIPPYSLQIKDKNSFWQNISYQDGFILGGE